MSRQANTEGLDHNRLERSSPVSIFSITGHCAKQRPQQLDELLAQTYPGAITWALARTPDLLMEDALGHGEAPVSYEERLAECRLTFMKHLATWMDHHGLSVSDLQAAPAINIPLPVDRDPLVLVLDPELLEPLVGDLEELARTDALADIFGEMLLEADREIALAVAA
ncbi:hypothetical protein [Actinocorallia aurantiaca]|uniref:Uncharacterized protein n=1 Tax=Actinocorallia aurantiaca TaxID=46204 RepID=A0ABN3UVD1_9ACTN